ncbi:uncharacterized protein K452DRAFT_242030 [Aplosporella prunicola CBS 121167]|uniref:Telomere length regulation protein conserved domain-containing protein n=1 Tax=Aplosporella prunicola CBS 121167 TaxID=1176127 RepID=A0A6A6BVZ2_9PEZI|nr:uncharacterized protein K452DRAFT_242030 [Aplosporella prunicola CBS 121167]KAF2146871.1 hypothetical protein K452DRAFT_242030 [Aplosporella prunicola CBS 121167]
MDGMLTAVKTTKIQVVESVESPPANEPRSAPPKAVASPDQCLTLMRDQPDVQTLENILQYLCGTVGETAGFNIKVPGPLSAQIINTLVNTIIPDYWDFWAQSSGQDSGRLKNGKERLLNCLRSISGLGALVTRFKALLAEVQQEQQQASKSHNAPQHLKNLVDVLLELLDCDTHFLSERWEEIGKIRSSTQRNLLWREAISLTASGRLVSTVAQSEDLLKSSTMPVSGTWLANGPSYAKWLGKGVFQTSCCQQDTDEPISAAALLLGKSLSLGYTENVVGEVLSQFLTAGSNSMQTLLTLLVKLRAHEQRQFLLSTLDFISKKFLNVNSSQTEDLRNTPGTMTGCIAFLVQIVSGSDVLKESLVSWLTGIAGATGSPALRRVAISAIQNDEARIVKAMERSMEQFGDELYIKHAPILQQEALTQVLLLSCGYVHRSQPMFLFTVARSSMQMKGTSNRIGATSPRARFLGMVTAMAISGLIDKLENRLKFEISDDETLEAKWYQQLVHVNDGQGSLDDMRRLSELLSATLPDDRSRVSSLSKSQNKKLSPGVMAKGGKKPSKAQNAPITGPRVIEILDESDDDDDLVSYAKPDSDPEDESEDPTLIQRNKPTAPVYIRDLIAGLRDNENYDRHQLALSSAAGLIRRKANFGKEVIDHIDELASVLLGLNDQFELDNFQEMRQQALIVLLLVRPDQVGPLLIRAFYGGDYSLSQRIAILTSLGLGAREMAGFREDSEADAETSSSSFPSKKLPEKLHKLYASESSPIDEVTNHLKRTMITPLALDAADQLSGPNALKVRAFSSRMEVEKKRKKPRANELAKIVAQSFFFPMTGGWWIHAKSIGSGNTFYSPILLPVFLKTLAILLHASGPSTLSLPQMTTEYWDLLLSLRASALNDVAILEALLFSFLTLLDVNEDKQRLVQEHAKELLETHEWVKLVFERTSGGDDEGDRVRSLAAGVLVRCSEVVEKHQRLLMGDMMDY